MKNINMYVGNDGLINMYQGSDKTQIFTVGTASGDSITGRYVKIPPIVAQTTSGGSYVKTGATGILYKESSSSRRYKEAISEKISEHLNPDKLYDIPIVEYVYKEGHLSKDDVRYGKKVIGFIAEDMDDIYPIAANYNDDGSVEDWNARFIIPGMLKLIQEQHKVDITLNSQVETLKNQLDEAMIKIASLEKQIDILKTA